MLELDPVSPVNTVSALNTVSAVNPVSTVSPVCFVGPLESLVSCVTTEMLLSTWEIGVRNPTECPGRRLGGVSD